MMIPFLLGQEVELYPVGVNPMRSTPDWRDPHEGGGEDVRGLADEYMMKLLWICMYGFWKVISSVHSRVWAFIVTDSNLPRNKKVRQGNSSNIDICHLPKLIGFSFVRLLGKVSPIPLPNMEVFPMAYTMMVDLRSSLNSGFLLL